MKINNTFRLGLLGGLGVLVAIAIGATVMSLATILTYVGAALFLALGLDPLVTLLEKKKVPRSIAIVIVLAGVLAVFAGLILAIVPVISDQINRAIETIPGLINGFADGTIREWVQTTYPCVPIDDVLAELQRWLAGLNYANIGGGILTAVVAVGQGVTGAFIVLILTLYFVTSLTSMKRGLYTLVPASRRRKFIDIAEQVAKSVGRYVIGQGSLALVNGILSFVVLTFVLPLFGVPVTYSALLAFLAFLGSLIPLVGTISASVVITLFVLIFDGTPSVFVVGAYYLVYMQVEAYVINPRIMSSAVQVPGAIVVIAALAGGTLLGILGALIAIPVAATILLIVNQVVVPRQQEL